MFGQNRWIYSTWKIKVWYLWHLRVCLKIKLNFKSTQKCKVWLHLKILKISEKSIIEFYVSIIINIWIHFLSNITLCNVGNESLF
jgi:hypothetical protein